MGWFMSSRYSPPYRLRVLDGRGRGRDGGGGGVGVGYSVVEDFFFWKRTHFIQWGLTIQIEQLVSERILVSDRVGYIDETK